MATVYIVQDDNVIRIDNARGTLSQEIDTKSDGYFLSNDIDKRGSCQVNISSDLCIKIISKEDFKKEIDGIK